VYPTGAMANLQVKVGTKVRFLNKFTTGNVTIHSGGPIPHEPDPGVPPGQAYEVTVNTTGTAAWYCHAPGPNPATDPRIVVVN
jgi:plastocyanin